MIALTLWEPWASLIAAGVKRHETRGWSTKYRGPLAIHAGKRLARPEVIGPDVDALCRRVLGPDWVATRPLGHVLAIVDVVACPYTTDVVTTADDRLAGNFEPGRFAWQLDNLRVLARPIAAQGKQGLWLWNAPRLRYR